MIHCNISSSFSEVVFTARVAFSKRSWPYLAAMAVPWLLCAGQRCVRRLAAMSAHRRSESGYYRFLSDGKWRLQVLFRCLFDLIVRTWELTELILVVDDTLCPKWGRGIFATGSFFDHAARPRPGYIWGHNWVAMAVVVQAGRHAWMALPFWIVPYRPEGTCAPGEFRTRHQLVVEVLEAVRSWFPGAITLLADGSYCNRSVVESSRRLGIALVSRLRSDARLRSPNPPRQPKGKRGRKPKHGPLLPRLRSLVRNARAFQPCEVTIYGKTMTVRVREVVGYWPPARAVVKVVIVREAGGRRRKAYLVSTDPGMSAKQVVELFARRWTIEQLFSVAKTHMGLDSAEVRKERAVRRHAALCMAMVTWAEVWIRRRRPRLRESGFGKKLAALRAESIQETIFASGPRCKGSREIASSLAALYATATSAA